jgi:hypothetical protein
MLGAGGYTESINQSIIIIERERERERREINTQPPLYNVVRFIIHLCRYKLCGWCMLLVFVMVGYYWCDVKDDVTQRKLLGFDLITDGTSTVAS